MGLATSMQRHWKGWAAGVVAVLLLVVVGGPFVYFHFIEGKTPAPLSLSTTTVTTAKAPAASVSGGTTVASTGAVEGTWNVASGSQAGYRIKESLFGQSHTAVGRTTAISGTIAIAGTSVTSGGFSVDMTQVTSDQAQRDDQFQNRIMDTASFPTATFDLTTPIALGTLPADGQQITENATGKLMLHGATRTVTFQLKAARSGATIQVSGSIPVVFADYNISNPSGGPATTSDNGTLEFLLNFAHG
jgi:polyisoprenoid-binding protein YceI